MTTPAQKKKKTNKNEVKKMAKALDAVTDDTLSSVVTMVGPRTFFVYGMSPDSRIQVFAKATGGLMPPQPVGYADLPVETNKPITLEFYGSDLYFQVENNNGSVTIEY